MYNDEIKNMNVMHFISAFVQGGTEKILLYFLKACKEEVTVVVMKDRIDEYLGQELVKTKHKIHFFNIKTNYKRPKYLFRLLKLINEKNIHIIHSHDFGSMMMSIFCKILKPKLKLVYTIHSSPIVKNWNRIILFFNRTFMDMNIAISEDILNDLVKRKLKAIKIYNGIDTKDRRQAAGDFSSFNIINVARITHQVKGQDILIKAFKECKDRGMKFACNLVGGTLETDSTSLDVLKKLIEELELSEEIVFSGNREDVSELLAQSDLFILPSRIEGLPVSLLEAMAAKIPVIASNISGSAELIEHEKNGLLFESENHADLAEKIMFLYNNREEMKRLAENGYEYVQGFDVSMMCEKYWELYKCLIK